MPTISTLLLVAFIGGHAASTVDLLYLFVLAGVALVAIWLYIVKVMNQKWKYEVGPGTATRNIQHLRRVCIISDIGTVGSNKANGGKPEEFWPSSHAPKLP